ncbi:MAG: prephenate dehydrogenase [Cyclobacteriaceae bacterium]|nr:prephenate dehydrogenase [Cyclobacteriaceae bacterium SS2]
MKILFIGTGLIGGSFSLAMQQQKMLDQAGGYSRNPENLDKSISLGIIQQKFDSLEAGISWADWIILSIPVDAIVKLLPGILDKLNSGQAVIDFGSTKGSICEAIRNHKNRSQFIAAHPIAGTEYSGPEAAFPKLFENKSMLICEKELTDPELMGQFEKLCIRLSMKVDYLGATDHDRHLAYISHLSHVTSYALSNAVLAKEKDGSVILEMAGSGFASTVRLAKSSPDMWAPIFLDNKKMVLEAIGQYDSQLKKFKQLLEKDDLEGMMSFLTEGRKIGKILK